MKRDKSRDRRGSKRKGIGPREKRSKYSYIMYEYDNGEHLSSTSLYSHLTLSPHSAESGYLFP